MLFTMSLPLIFCDETITEKKGNFFENLFGSFVFKDFASIIISCEGVYLVLDCIWCNNPRRCTAPYKWRNILPKQSWLQHKPKSEQKTLALPIFACHFFSFSSSIVQITNYVNYDFMEKQKILTLATTRDFFQFWWTSQKVSFEFLSSQTSVLVFFKCHGFKHKRCGPEPMREQSSTN